MQTVVLNRYVNTTYSAYCDKVLSVRAKKRLGTLFQFFILV